MPLPKNYNPQEAESRLNSLWAGNGIYHFTAGVDGEIYSIDTPPPTVSGNLHLGHVYSYSHADFIARFWRMNGRKVFYPMGFDDNGLPTERLVEKRLGIRASQVGRSAFIDRCLQVSEEAEQDYRRLWQRLGLSIDWRYSYRTIDARSRHTAQRSFIDLHDKGLVYRKNAPSIWCPECHTAIAQAELNDLDRQTEFITLAFRLAGNNNSNASLAIATTRPELLPACVAVFVHPDDGRFKSYAGQSLIVPFSGKEVPILEDASVDPGKGTGAVMCCTFGDTVDVNWWYRHKLPLIEALDRDGHMTQAAGAYAHLSVSEARKKIIGDLQESGLILDRQPVSQSVRVHERCDTPVEYIVTHQWFIKVLDHKEELLKAGDKIRWRPEPMRARYHAWVENLSWDWCISRQRYFGVPFPVWYCQECGRVILAGKEQLPVDPNDAAPTHPCECGGSSFTPEPDVMDTWATSSLTPQIVGQWLSEGGREHSHSSENDLYERVFPFSLRPQAHEIIRTWAFYTIVQSTYHFNALPWKDVLISGWGLAGDGKSKISKSRGGGPMPPLEMIERYSADAVRYWAASTGSGKDSVISEEKIQMGAKLVTKLWNIARFCERFLEGYKLPGQQAVPGFPGGQAERIEFPHNTIADRWILSRTQRLIQRVTDLFYEYEYAAAKSEIETFIWRELADNYLEMSKQRLYDPEHPLREGALFSIYCVLISILKLLAPFLPYVTEEIYLNLFMADYQSADKADPNCASIHTAAWPQSNPTLLDEQAEIAGEAFVDIATAVRRFKSDHNLPLGTELPRLQLATSDHAQAIWLNEGIHDLKSICRVRQLEIAERLDHTVTPIISRGDILVGIELNS